MPVQKICRYCGKKYDASGTCDCVFRQRAIQKFRQSRVPPRVPDSFYRTKKWKATKNAVFFRAAGLDEFLMFFDYLQTSGKIEDVFKGHNLAERTILTGLRSLSGYGCMPMFSKGRAKLLVHHIIPKEEDMAYAYDMNNLIGVTVDTHNWIHKMYGMGERFKIVLQRVLRLAVIHNSRKEKETL